MPEENNDIQNAETEPAATNTVRLQEYRQLRSSTKGNISRIKTAVNKSAISVEELECRLGILESYFKQALSVNTNILRICPADECDSHEKAMAEIEDVYVATKAKIKELLNTKRSDGDTSLLNTTVIHNSQSSMKRHIKLPTFDGKYSEFPKFMGIFNKMINQDDTLSDCERFLLLKTNLSGRALQAIDDFEISGVNYKKALDRLKNNFEKKNLMFEEHIAALFQLKKVADSIDLRKAIDSVNAHLSAMLSLGNYINITNAMLIYLVATKLDDESLKKWEEATDYTKLSTWEDCSSVLTKRCENMEVREAKTGRCVEKDDDASKTARKENRKMVGGKKVTLAVERGGCGVCKKDGHNVELCSEFGAMKMYQRRKAVRSLQLCFLCLQGGHRHSDCKAKRCSECGGAHHKMLHNNKLDEKATDARGQTQSLQWCIMKAQK